MYMIVHGHFYQPPREDPWTGQVEEQPDASPFHDWNQRIQYECYRANARAVVPTSGEQLVCNNYERLSFNFGPTLLSWMERADRDTYERIVEADRISRVRLGHGNALAQSFHHSILPLAPARDARTEISWGLADFRHRFDRDAEGMWLPETAANPRTLEQLIEGGVRFTILAPHQAVAWRELNGDWRETADQSLDTRVVYRFDHRDGSGRSLAVFFYDGDIAQEIAFGKAPASAEKFVDLFAARVVDGGLVHAATDGETYGHHQEFGELGLAYALFVEAPGRGIDIINYASYLDRFPPVRAVEIDAQGTSWSCAHGLDRWGRDCGCWTRAPEGAVWNQAWRAPLRAALEIVRGAAGSTFERQGKAIFRDAWGARDRYVQVLLGQLSAEEFVRREGVDADVDVHRGASLLELQRNALSMFTSCGWFFSDCGGIETVQVLRYAARALELLAALGEEPPLQPFLEKLATAKSNEPELGTAADIYERAVRTEG